MIFSDHLSQNVDTGKSKEPTCEGLDLKVPSVLLNASSENCVSLANENIQISSANSIKAHNHKGWPKQRNESPHNLKNSWNYPDELSILDGLVLKDTRIVIPSQCQGDILTQLHEGTFWHRSH